MASDVADCKNLRRVFTGEPVPLVYVNVHGKQLSPSSRTLSNKKCNSLRQENYLTPYGIVLLGRWGYATEEQLQIGSHHYVGIQFDSVRWALSFYEEVVERLEGHAALGLRTLIDGRENPAGFKERHELGK